MRVNVFRYPNGYTDPIGFDEPVFAGWFETTTAERWDDADYDGNGSGGTGRGQALYRTAGGKEGPKWVLANWSRWQGEGDTFEYATDDGARDWLLRNGEDEAVEQFFGPIPEEEDRRPGRPKVGERAYVNLSAEMRADVDRFAAEGGVPRAEAIRILVAAGLNAIAP